MSTTCRRINETLGYGSGSELLRSIGSRLSRAFRDDERFTDAVVGRFGADEFAIAVPGVGNEADIREVTDTVKRTIEAPFLINGRDLFLKAAIGAAWHPDHGRDALAVFRSAEAALHRSMRTIDNAVTYYHREMGYRARHMRQAHLHGRVRLRPLSRGVEPGVHAV